ncbi:MAG TPA: helix-turn-helix transcriptional regulator [Bryobacteraceae bacterium]|nr:helix-turn-helix transcriptional regulator [Bryobacteraceae bacterium]
MARSDTLQGSLDLLVLKALSRRPCLHGYAIMAAIGERSNDLLRNHQGSHYPALQRTEEGGWTRAEWVTKEAAAERSYELTQAGEKQLADEQERSDAVTSAANRFLRTV